jgi:hypothetical protein
VREGWCSFAFSFDLAPSSFSPTGPRRYGLVLASRLPLVTHDPERFPLPWQERVLSATIRVLAGLELTPAATLECDEGRGFRVGAVVVKGGRRPASNSLG